MDIMDISHDMWRKLGILGFIFQLSTLASMKPS